MIRPDELRCRVCGQPTDPLYLSARRVCNGCSALAMAFRFARVTEDSATLDDPPSRLPRRDELAAAWAREPENFAAALAGLTAKQRAALIGYVAGERPADAAGREGVKVRGAQRLIGRAVEGLRMAGIWV